ncbi:MAG: HPr kinase/phosphatase C-terminal domain-containing protein [Pararhodobacter sp.]|nr:HPr kinase/phosphatase C-terminal domain-containing protein [Pararhodobacter sp.]
MAFGPEHGLALIGPAGAGKSSLALALINAGAQLVGDDRLHVFARGSTLFARPPRSIAGLIEQRGLGPLRLGFLRLARLRLIIDLSEPESRRLPHPDEHRLCGIKLPCLRAPVTGSTALATFPFAVRQYMCGSAMAG